MKVEIDYTYLSKLENERTNHPPKENVIRKLANELDLDPKALIFLSGRIPEADRELLQQQDPTWPALFRRIRQDSKTTEDFDNSCEV